MSQVFAIGDLQGCAEDWNQLLTGAGFDASHDRLWLVGDLVSRGPDSLTCLRRAHAMGERLTTVLGNHDLHLLALAAGVSPKAPGDLAPVLQASDSETLLDWLRHRPLLHHDAARRLLLVHAGLPPQWAVDDALEEAEQVQQALRGPRSAQLLAAMYGDAPDRWRPGLSGMDRLRFAINCFTRLRYCSATGQLLLKHKMPPGDAPEGALPWFAAPRRASADTTIVFGHWSTLGQVHWPEHKVYGLDTGCVWGGALTALDLDTRALYRRDCDCHRAP